MDRITGRALAGESHLAQSIADILTTPVGTRVMRRDYGSTVPQLLDAPLNGQTLLEFYGAVADALRKWEPRVTLARVQVVAVTETGVEIELSGTWADRPSDTGSVIDGAIAQAGNTEVSL
jgi:phage baseplate assembly protein W